MRSLGVFLETVFWFYVMAYSVFFILDLMWPDYVHFGTDVFIATGIVAVINGLRNV